jgi:hypothetical protein
VPGCLVAQEHAKEQEEGGDGLQRERDNPYCVATDVEQAPVVDPKSEHDAADDELLVQAGEEASDGARSVLRYVQRYCNGSNANS